MKYGFRSEIPGMNEQEYEQMHAYVGPKWAAYPGAVSHVAGPSENGWFIAEVWDSKDDYERFMREVVLPVMPPDAPPLDLEEFEVHTAESRP